MFNEQIIMNRGKKYARSSYVLCFNELSCWKFKSEEKNKKDQEIERYLLVFFNAFFYSDNTFNKKEIYLYWQL